MKLKAMKEIESLVFDTTTLEDKLESHRTELELLAETIEVIYRKD